MADFWIKVEKGTPDKPEILEIASILNISDPDTITGKLIRVWSWFDSNSENGHAPRVTNVLIDRMTGVTGFTDALVTVGWLTLSEDGSYMMSNFDRHIGRGAKKRASDAERKRKSRQSSSKCHEPSVTKEETETGLDKSRVDKSKDIDLSPNGSPSRSAPVPYKAIIDSYNAMAAELEFPCVRSHEDSKRKASIKRIWNFCGKDLERVDGLFKYFAQVTETKRFYRGDNDRGWVANLDYIGRAEILTKIEEGTL